MIKYLFLIGIIIHAAICVMTYLMIKRKRIKLPVYVMPILCWLPLWGYLAAAAIEVRLRKENKESRQLGLEKLKVNERVHKSVLRDEDETQDITVPFEEAMLINEGTVRRELLIDSLYKNPEKQLQTLKDIRLDTDTEVMHYATTAMVELQREFELELQKMEVLYRQDTEDLSVLDYYISLMERYIKSGLIDGSFLKILRNRYSGLLYDKLELIKEDLEISLKIADNEIELKNYSEAESILSEITKKWNADERGWLLLIKLHATNACFNEIPLIVEQIRKDKIYLSPQGKETIKFWSNEV